MTRRRGSMAGDDPDEVSGTTESSETGGTLAAAGARGGETGATGGARGEDAGAGSRARGDDTGAAGEAGGGTAGEAGGGARWVEVAPERIVRWVGTFIDRHGPVTAEPGRTVLVLRGADGAVAECQ